MKKIFNLIFLIFLANCSAQTIQETHDFDLIIKTINKTASQNTLLLLDVDGVLIVPGCDHDFFGNSIRKELWKKYTKNMSKQEKMEFLSLVLINWQAKLTDIKVLEMIKIAQQKGMKIAALTKMGQEKTKAIPDGAKWRYLSLKNLGIDFQSLSNHEQNMNWPDLKKESAAYPPLFYKGIIFTGGIDKGVVLERFLKDTGTSPQTIIFVDDQRSNVEDVKRMCQNLNIRYRGYAYHGAKLLPCPPLDKSLEEKRMNILFTKKKWISLHAVKKDFYVSNHKQYMDS